MPRQSITFTTPQNKWLEKVAKLYGISVGELVRRIIDKAREDDKWVVRD